MRIEGNSKAIAKFLGQCLVTNYLQTEYTTIARTNAKNKPINSALPA